MGNESVDANLERLLEEGVEIPDDVTQIEALLLGETVDSPDEGQQDPKGGGEKGSDPQDKDDPSSGDGEPAGKASKDDEKSTSETPPAAEDDDEKGPPRIVLKRTRESLHRAERELQEERERRENLERELQELRAKLDSKQQDLQDKADEISGGGVQLEGLTDEAIEAMRADLDDTVVNGIRALRDAYVKLSQEFDKTRQREDELRKEQESREAEQLQADIDSVPLLAVISATRGEEADALWQRAVAYEKVIRADPDFEGKSRREIFAEVAKRLENYLGPEAAAKWLGEGPAGNASKTREQIVEEQLARARESAIPTSLSDLPAGTPAAQSERERAEAMSLFDLEDVLDKALERGGTEEVDALLARLLTAER